MDRDADRAQHDEAREMLGTCTAETPRPLLAWAVGVCQVGHAVDFARIPLVPEEMGPSYAGGTLPYGRMYLATRKGFSVQAASQTIVTVGWREVADLVRPARVAHMPPRIAAALERRRELTGTNRRDDIRANNDECGAIGYEIWRLCRPAVQEEQQSLF